MHSAVCTLEEAPSPGTRVAEASEAWGRAGGGGSQKRARVCVPGEEAESRSVCARLLPPDAAICPSILAAICQQPVSSAGVCGLVLRVPCVYIW